MQTSTNLQNVKDFFTNEEWDAIDQAMAEYQDHGDEATELMHSVTNKIYDLFRDY